MARKIDTRDARRKLAIRSKPYFARLTRDLFLGYRRLRDQDGTWIARRYLQEDRYETEAIGRADDRNEANGDTILDYDQAQDKAREWFKGRTAGPKGKAGPITVEQACESYVDFLRDHRKTADDTDGRLRKHVIPRIGKIAVADLTQDDVEKVQRAMVRRDPEDPDVERRSKDTANRVMTMLKAALSHARQKHKKAIPKEVEAEWRDVKQFRDVGRSRQVHLDEAQSLRLINVCEGAFRNLVAAALYTGARAPDELAKRRVRDFNADARTLTIIDGKTGDREIFLTAKAIKFFKNITDGRAPDALLLPRDDGKAWGKSHQARPMKEAVHKAKLPKGCTLYSLRHTYASQQLKKGCDIKSLAENMGTSVRMIEKHYGKFFQEDRRRLVEQFGPNFDLPPVNVTPLQARA
jgi:integrase